MLAAALGIPVAILLTLLGVRVLRSERHGAGLPERLVGIFFACMGLGAPGALLSNDATLVPTAWAPFAMAVGHALLSVGFGALFLFSWRCFDPDSGWRRSLALGGCGILAILWLAQGLLEHFVAPGGGVVRSTALVRAVSIAWAFGEALRFRALMQRRMALGLGDPIVANRFLLWSLWTGAMLGASVVATSVRFLLPEFGPHVPPSQRIPIVFTFLGFATTGGASLWLAFFPPRWYLARLRVHASA